MIILFDFDGTLVDSRGCILQSMARAFEQAGETCPPAADLLATVGLQPEDMLAELTPDLSVETRRQIAQDYRRNSIELRGRDPSVEHPFPGADEALAELRAAGHRLGVVTGKSAHGLKQCLGHFGWSEAFDDLRPCDGAPGKPDPTLIHWALEAFGANPSDAVMVGDTSFDMIMAQRAAVRPIGIAWGYHPVDRLRTSGADYIAQSFGDLLDHLASLENSAST